LELSAEQVTELKRRLAATREPPIGPTPTRRGAQSSPASRKPSAQPTRDDCHCSRDDPLCFCLQ
jgi:hypothetical protein